MAGLVAGDEASVYRLSLPIASLVTLEAGLDGFLAVEKHLLVRQVSLRTLSSAAQSRFDSTKRRVVRWTAYSSLFVRQLPRRRRRRSKAVARSAPR